MAKDMGTDMGNPLAIRQVDGKWKDGQSDRRTDRRMDIQMEDHMARWMHRWKCGLVGGQIHKISNG